MSRRSQNVRLRYFASVSGVYDSGLTSYVAGPNGVISSASWGTEIRGGIYGTKSWRQTDLSLSFVGGYRAYTQASSLNGYDQGLTLGVSHQFSPKFFLQTSNVVSTANRSFGYGYGFVTPGLAGDPAFNPVNQNDIYDARFFMVSNSNSLIYQFGPRLSVSAGGGPYLTKRIDTLITSYGVQAAGDLSYRLTRSQTLTGSYQFFQFNYSNQYGNSAVSQVAIAWAAQVRRWDFKLMAAGAAVESEGSQVVKIDPDIAAIVGFSQGYQAFYSKNYFPVFRASANSRYPKATVGVSAFQQISPGNGVILTSMFRGGMAYVSYTGLRKWTATARTMYSSYRALVRFNNKSTFYDFGGQIGYQIRPSIQAFASAIWRNQENSQTALPGTGMRFAFGLSYSPGEIPLALW